MVIFIEKSVYYTQVNMVQLNPAISNSNPFPLDLPYFAQSFTIGYLELSYLKLPISNKEQHPLFLFHRQIYPTISNSQLYVLSKLLLPSRVQD